MEVLLRCVALELASRPGVQLRRLRVDVAGDRAVGEAEVEATFDAVDASFYARRYALVMVELPRDGMDEPSLCELGDDWRDLIGTTLDRLLCEVSAPCGAVPMFTDAYCPVHPKHVVRSVDRPGYNFTCTAALEGHPLWPASPVKVFSPRAGQPSVPLVEEWPAKA